jgi:hypothetical protein
MREGNPVADQAAAGPGRRRLRPAAQPTVLALGGLVLALIAASWPFAALAHLSPNASTGGSPYWTFLPLGVFVVEAAGVVLLALTAWLQLRQRS